MHERQLQTVQIFPVVLDYFVHYPIEPEPPLLTGKRRQLGEIVRRIEECVRIQETVRMHDAGVLDARRKQLRKKRMLPLRSIAKVQLKFAPGVEAAIRVPHARASAQVVAAAARRMANALMPHARLLASAGINKDFLRQMVTEARALALTTKQNGESLRRRREATATIAAEIKKGVGIVDVMEGMVMIHGNSVGLRQWKIVRRIPKKVGRPRKVRHRKPRVALVS